MRAIALSAVIALACAAQITSRFNDTIADMAAALAENNAPRFLEFVDPNMPGYDRLKSNIEALANQADVHSGIDTLAENGNEVDVDWAMEITARGEPSEKERRRDTVHLKFEQQGKHWKVVSLEPVDLFAPPKPGR